MHLAIVDIRIAAPNALLVTSLCSLCCQGNPSSLCSKCARTPARSAKEQLNNEKNKVSRRRNNNHMSSSFLESIQSLFFGGGANRCNEQKLKTNLKILSGRIKLLTDKRRARIASNENAIAKVLETSSSFKAMSSSSLDDDDNTEDARRGASTTAEISKAMETLLARCELIGKETKFLEILKRVQSFASAILETCERQSSELELTGKNRTAVASMFYAKSADGGRLVNDLPELKTIANELAKKFGKEFALSCEREKTSEACGVSKAFMVIAKERRNDMRGKEARLLLEKMAKEKGVALPSTSAKKKPSSSSSKKKKKSTRRSTSSSEASSSSGESSDIDNTSSSRRKSNETSNYASAETAAKAARDAANKAQEAAEYAEALVATNELFATTLKHDDDDDDVLDMGTEKEDEINSIIAAAADEAKLEEGRIENENKESSAPLRRKTNGGGPPPGVASAAQKKKTVVDDALADRFEKLKTTKK
jgi:hypothetical protein